MLKFKILDIHLCWQYFGRFYPYSSPFIIRHPFIAQFKSGLENMAAAIIVLWPGWTCTSSHKHVCVLYTKLEPHFKIIQLGCAGVNIFAYVLSKTYIVGTH